MIFARLFYFVYFFVLIMLVLGSLSALIFNSKFKLKDFVTTVGVAIIWPVALFSKNGRQQLLSFLKKDVL